jgi:hypothetical protein
MFIDEYYDKDFNRVVDVVHGKKVLARAVFHKFGVRTSGSLSSARDIAREQRNDKMLTKLTRLEAEIALADLIGENRVRTEQEFSERARQESERYDAEQRSIEE